MTREELDYSKLDYSKISKNKEVIKLLKERKLLEDKISKLDPKALIKYELEVINL